MKQRNRKPRPPFAVVARLMIADLYDAGVLSREQFDGLHGVAQDAVREANALASENNMLRGVIRRLKLIAAEVRT